MEKGAGRGVMVGLGTSAPLAALIRHQEVLESSFRSWMGSKNVTATDSILQFKSIVDLTQLPPFLVFFTYIGACGVVGSAIGGVKACLQRVCGRSKAVPTEAIRPKTPAPLAMPGNAPLAKQGNGGPAIEEDGSDTEETSESAPNRELSVQT